MANSTDDNVNSSDSSNYMYERHIPVLAVVIIEVVILFVSLIGNAIVVLIVVKKRRMQSFTNWLILNLAVADVYSVLICIPLEIPLELNTSSSSWPYGKFFCRIYYPMQTASIYGSVFTLVALSISRWWAVIHPFRRQPTVTFAKVLIAVIWFCSFAVVVPYIMVLQYNPNMSECSEVWTDKEKRRYTLAIFIFQYVFPLCVISLAYAWITIDLSLRSKETALPKDKAKRIETKKVVKLLLVVTVTFAVCILPYHLVAIFSEFANASEFRYIADVTSMAYVILYLNAALNPILYNVFNSKFREAFIELYVTIKTYVFGSKDELSGKGFFSSRRPSMFDARRISRTSTGRSQNDSIVDQRHDALAKPKRLLLPQSSANSYTFCLIEQKPSGKCLTEDAAKPLFSKNENNTNNNEYF